MKEVKFRFQRESFIWHFISWNRK